MPKQKDPKDVTTEECRWALKECGGNKTEAARLLGIPRTTFRCKLSEVPEDELPAAREHKLSKENRALRSQVTELLEEIEKLGEYNSIVQSISTAPSSPPTWVSPKQRKGRDRGIVTATLSDCHFDEVVNPAEVNFVNAYNRDIATIRLKEFFSNTIRLSRDYINGIEVEGLVLPMLGDMVSGNIHEELRETNEAPIAQTCLYYADHIAAGIHMLLEYFPKIYVPCVVGNHGRMDRKPRAKGRPFESFDYILYHLVSREFKDIPEVTFNISDESDLRYTLYETRYQLTHGDQFRGGSGIAGMLSPLMIGDHRKRKREQAVGTPYDYLVMGHWHQLAHFKGVIVNGSLKGYDEYAAISNFEYEPPQQALWLTDPRWGKTIDAPIHVRSDEEDWGSQRRAEVAFG